MRAKTLKPRLQLLNTQRLRAAPVRNGTARQRGGAWMERRAVQLQREPLCRHCAQLGLVALALEVDHVIPLWRGPGLDTDSNLQSLCIACHLLKTQREAKERNAVERA